MVYERACQRYQEVLKNLAKYRQLLAFKELI